MTETKDTTFFAMKLLEFQTAEDPFLFLAAESIMNSDHFWHKSSDSGVF